MSTPPRRPDRVVLALAIVGLLLRLIPSLRPLQALDDLALPDDAYLSLTIARNLAHGLGPWYGLAATNGFQPLYVYLMAPVYALLGPDPVLPVRVAVWLLIACDVATLLVLARMVARFTRQPLPARLVAAGWALSPYAIVTSLNGLETSLSCLLALLALDAFLARRAAVAAGSLRPRDGLVLGAWIGLAGLARIDNLLLFPVLALALAMSPAPLARRVQALAAMAAATALVQLPWLAISWRATGLLFPVSGSAVRFQSLSNAWGTPTWDNWYGPVAWRAVRVVARRNVVSLALIAGLALALPFLGRADRGSPGSGLRERLRPLATAFAFGALLFVAYTAVIFGPWYFPRYFFPLTLPLALGVGALSDEALSRLAGARARRALTAGLVLFVVAGSVLQPGFRRLYAPGPPAPWGYMRIGLWARTHFPDGAVIGSSQTGALGYWADNLTVVNLDGVVNQAAYQALRQRRALDYTRSAGIRYLIWQDDIDFLIRQTEQVRPGDVELVGTIAEFETVGQPWLIYRVRGAAARGTPILAPPAGLR